MPKTSNITLGDIVYLRVSSDEVGIVTGIIQRLNGVSYLIGWHDRTESEHQAIELTTDKTFS